MPVRSLCILALIVVCSGCGYQPRFEDKTQIKIADFQDRRMTDSLLVYLHSDNASHQKAAVLAFGSVQDTTVVGKIWKGPIYNSLRELAFTLGQTNIDSSAGLLKIVAANATYKNDNLIEAEAYEALGKVIGKKDLEVFVTPKEGFAIAPGVPWGIYRAGLRGVVDSDRTALAARALGEVTSSDRLGAAHFFSRAAFTPTPEVITALSQAVIDNDVEVRMAATSALAKLKPEEAIGALTKAIKDRDYRVRVSAARALRIQPWEIAKPHFETLLSDSNVHVNVAAAEVIINIGKDTTAIAGWARNATNWRAQATLYECLMKLSPIYSNEVKSLFEKSTSPYQKAALISALSQGDNTDFIFKEFKNNETKVLKSTASSAIARINRRQPKDSYKFTEFYKQIINDGDQGAIIYACGALGDTTLGFKKLITDVSFLEEAKSKLSLPKDYETYAPLEETLNYLKNLAPPPPLKNEFNHPIDWELAATIKINQLVVIETTKGKIMMALFIEEAPGSVVNFVKLVKDKYYDGKFFHRVVPNFVIQTGCDRGDGFGSLDYSIRSEFSTRRYKTGSVGMASAGKDTEGVQWFITHSPTPHLDGKYTIFAEVVEGMDVVHKIEVGDKIISAHLAD